MRALRLELVLLLTMIAAPAFAADITVERPWFRMLPAHLPAAGYFTLHNAGKSTVILTGATSRACGVLMLHKSSGGGGMASMSDVDRVTVPAGASFAFAPNGYHLMCMDPTSAMKHGVSIPVTLQFADGKSLAVDFVVRDARGQ